MSDGTVKLVVALIGLTGTLAASYIAYRQWRLSRRDSAKTDFLKIRRESYQALWQMVETVHTDLRLEPGKLPGLRDRIARINSYVLKNEIYLSDGDHELVDSYLRALGEMISWSQLHADPVTHERLAETGGIPSGADCLDRAFELRDKLKNRIRRALSEE